MSTQAEISRAAGIKPLQAPPQKTIKLIFQVADPRSYVIVTTLVLSDDTIWTDASGAWLQLKPPPGIGAP